MYMINTDALRLSGFLAAVPIHEIIPRDNYAVIFRHTRLCGGTQESNLYDTCSPKLYDIDLKIASWKKPPLARTEQLTKRGGLSLPPHKSNSVSPQQSWGFPQFIKR